MSNYSTAQRGATLIVTLMVLLMVTIIGVLAIRIAMTTLNISTNAQISQLLSQTADTPINQIYTSNLSNMVNLSGAIGYAIEDSKTDPGKEYIFCYRPTNREKFGTSLNVTVLRPPASSANADTKATVTEGGKAGFCDLKTDFGSSREAIVTQVSIKIPNDTIAGLARGATLGRGTNLSSGTIMPKNLVEQQRIRVTTTAILPAYGKDINAAQGCIGVDATQPGYINDNLDADTAGKRTVAECLVNLGVPVISQIQEFNLQTLFEQTTAP